MAIDPKYQALINADPEYSQYGAMTTAQSQADKAARDTAMRRSMEDFGQVPDLNAAASSLGINAPDLASIFTPEAQTIAQSNTTAGTSTVARLNQAYADAQRNVVNALASRGMMRSGDTGYGLNRASQTNTQQQFDARKTLLDYLAGAQSGYAEAERTRQTGSYDALMAAYNRALANWKDVAPVPAADATPALAPAPTPAPAASAWATPANPVEAERSAIQAAAPITWAPGPSGVPIGVANRYVAPAAPQPPPIFTPQPVTTPGWAPGPGYKPRY